MARLAYECLRPVVNQGRLIPGALDPNDDRQRSSAGQYPNRPGPPHAGNERTRPTTWCPIDCALIPHRQASAWSIDAHSADDIPEIGRCRSAWISQSLKEDNERPKDNGKAAEQRADGVCRSHGLSNQKEQEKAHGQKDDDPLDPHVALLVFRVHPRLFERRPACTGRSLDAFRPLMHVR